MRVSSSYAGPLNQDANTRGPFKCDHDQLLKGSGVVLGVGVGVTEGLDLWPGDRGHPFV